METAYRRVATSNMMTGNGAIIVGEFRYRLWRTWDETRTHLLWALLNPSTAGEQIDDPTLKRCKAFSKKWGYGALEIINLFAFRAAHPHGLYTTSDPIGPMNDHYIADAATRATNIILAWGQRGTYQQRDRAMLTLLQHHTPQSLYCLGTTRNGCPCHPLYMPYSTVLVPYLPASS